MTLCPSDITHKDGKDAWHWLGLAISLSFTLGINRNILQAVPNLRKKRLERRIWWAAFVRDRVLALSSNGKFAKPVRIKRGDCDVDLLCMDDFDLDDEEDMRAKNDAKECVQRALLCWCTNDTLVSSCSPTHQRPIAATPRSIFIPQSALTDNLESEQNLYTGTSASSEFDAQPSFFENSPTEMGSTSPSMHEDCMTPIEQHPEPDQKVVCSSPLGGGYGVDGEYDDYFEYLRPSIQHGSEKRVKVVQEGEDRSTWAFQLDCENDRVLSI